MLTKLSLAIAKVTVGRIRSRYTQSNALWTQDGETLLQEGNEELKELKETPKESPKEEPKPKSQGGKKKKKAD